MEKLVLIHVDDIEYHKIQNIASRMKITVDRIPEEIVTANYKLGELVNGAYKNAADTIDGTGREQENVTGHSSETGAVNAQAKSRADSLILVCNLKEKRLDSSDADAGALQRKICNDEKVKKDRTGMNLILLYDYFL